MATVSKAKTMQTTPIDWTDYSWNPVTGCLTNCDYCYGRKRAKRNLPGTDPDYTPMFHPDRILMPQNTKPLQESVVFTKPEIFDWYIIGALSNGKQKVQPATAWTQSILEQAHAVGKKVWMKDNLIYTPFVREQPNGA
jgi:protein gp37